MPAPVEVQILMRVLMLLLVAVGCGWAVMTWLVKICPKASRFFALSNVLILFGLILLQQRTAQNHFWYWEFSDLLILCGFLALFYGIISLYKTAFHVKFEWGFILAVCLLYIGLTDGANNLTLVTVVFSLLSMLIFARCAWAEWRAIQPDFGLSYAVFFAAPLAMFSLFFGWRALDAWQQTTPDFASLVFQSHSSIEQLWFFIVLILILNFNLVGFAISRLVSKIRQLADKDWLTGVWSKRIIMQQLEYHQRDSVRNKRVFCLLILDLDHFKKINDTFGHTAGDMALQQASACFQQQLRQTDWLGRFGGEEFVVILPETTLPDATEIAERIRTALAKLVLPQPINSQLTVSIGVAQYQTPQEIHSLLERADQAMYSAKNNGRNQVVTL